VASHRERNKALKFKLGDDPQSYVTAKLEVLRYIDKFLSNRKKVEKLLEGLPYDFQQQLVLTDIPDPNDFVARLRKLSELYARHHPKQVTPFVQSADASSSIYSAPLLAQATYAQPSRNSNQRAIPQPHFNDNFTQNLTPHNTFQA